MGERGWGAAAAAGHRFLAELEWSVLEQLPRDVLEPLSLGVKSRLDPAPEMWFRGYGGYRTVVLDCLEGLFQL